jgi:hypothetical protein
MNDPNPHPTSISPTEPTSPPTSKTGHFVQTLLTVIGILVAIPVILAIPVGIFLGYCWVIAWMVAHIFL